MPDATIRPEPRSPSRLTVCARVRGGIGNQLFIYAAARALARRSGAELWLDTHSVYHFDRRRQYRLDAFAIEERVAPLGMYSVAMPRWRRTPRRWLSRLLPYARRRYIEQPWLQFVPELPSLRLRRSVYLDGFWQSEAYFADCADLIRQELRFRRDAPESARPWLERIQSAPSVAVHVRRTDSPVFLSPRYFANAVARLGAEARRCQFFIFSDEPDWARGRLTFPGPTFVIDHNSGAGGELEDFRLMRACRHFITGNSTFSWWAAWLGTAPDKRVLTPAPHHEWGYATRLPASWEQVSPDQGGRD